MRKASIRNGLIINVNFGLYEISTACAVSHCQFCWTVLGREKYRAGGNLGVVCGIAESTVDAAGLGFRRGVDRGDGGVFVVYGGDLARDGRMGADRVDGGVRGFVGLECLVESDVFHVAPAGGRDGGPADAHAMHCWDGMEEPWGLCGRTMALGGAAVCGVAGFGLQFEPLFLVKSPLIRPLTNQPSASRFSRLLHTPRRRNYSARSRYRSPL